MPRNYAKEYKNYQGLPKSIKERASRNKARKIMIDKHGEKACKNKHIDHKDHNPLNNKLSNLRIRNPSTNMSDNKRKKK
jgi:hypothetical protein